MNDWRKAEFDARNSRATEVLLEHRACLVRYVLKLSRDEHVAEDVAQESILRALEGRGCPEDADSALRWLKRTAYHLWIDHVRRRGLRSESFDGENEPLAPTEDFGVQEREVRLGATTVDWQWLQEELPQAIRGVPNSYRDLICRRYVRGQSCRVIASAVGISVGNVKTRLYRGRKALRNVLHTRACSHLRYVPRAGKPTGGVRT